MESSVRIADRPKKSASQVLAPAVRIDEARLLARLAAPGHGVDGEVAPGQVLLDRIAELDTVGVAVIRVRDVTPERRDLVLGTSLAHDHGPEAVLVQRVREEALNAVRRRVGREVPIRRLAAEQRVAQAAAHCVGGVSASMESGQQLGDRGGYLRDRRPFSGRPGLRGAFGPRRPFSGRPGPPISGQGRGTCASSRCGRRAGTA